MTAPAETSPATTAPAATTASEPAAGASTPAAAPARSGDDPIASTLRALQADNATLASGIKERDERLAAAEAKTAELQALVDGHGRAQREGTIVGKLRDALPSATDLEIRGVLGGLHERGKVDRYSDKPDEAAAAALALIKDEAPSLTRVPTSGGGNAGVRTGPPTRTHKSLI